MFKSRDVSFKISKEINFGNVSCKLGKGRKIKLSKQFLKNVPCFKTNHNKIQNVVKDLDITYNYETR